MKRRYDLDWLRVIAFALLMLFHTGMLFSSWTWHVKNLETSDYFDYVMRFLHSWRMPLLFFISGSAVWFAMEKFSAGRYFLERQKRLLLPLVFGMLVVIPPQVYFERLYQQQHYSSFLDFYRTVFTSGSYPEGNLSWHHLWYIPYIWAYSMLLFPMFMWFRSDKGRALLSWMGRQLQRPWVLFLVFLPSTFAEILLRPYWPGDANNLINDWANFTHKLSFFVVGFILASSEGVYDTLARKRITFLAAAVISFALLIPFWYLQIRLPNWIVLPYRFLSNFEIWAWILAALGFARRYLSFNHPVLRYANEAVYPFYILHQTVIIILGFYLIRMGWGMPVKFLVTVVATFLVCTVIYATLIRPWNPMRILFGMGWSSTAARQAVPRKAESSWGLPGLPNLARTGAAVALLAVLAVATVAGCSAKRGTLVWRTVPASSLAGNEMGVSSEQPLAVYLPPSYSDETGRRYPVLYWLPNFNTLTWRYTGGTYQGFRLRESMDRQIKAGILPEMIVVIPNATHGLGGSWYHNNSLTGKWEDYVSGDLVAYVDSHFRTKPDRDARAIAGHGMGGMGALELATRHPEVFGSSYAMSPAVLEQEGLRASGLLGYRRVSEWITVTATWGHLGLTEQKRAFREYTQAKLNSSSGFSQMQGIMVSCAAAFGCNQSLPFPHFNLNGGADSESGESVAGAVQRGLGDWETKMANYAARKPGQQTFIIEYGRSEEYEWIRKGAEHVSGLLRAAGVPCGLQVREGGHDNTLGTRLETAMLPAVGAALKRQQ